MPDFEMPKLDHSHCLGNGGGTPCGGETSFRYPLSSTGRSFARCDAHWDMRLREQERINRDYPDSPLAPAWFDPTAAGERWKEEG